KASASEISAALQARYGAPSDVIQTRLCAWLDELQQETVIAADGAQPPHSPQSESPVTRSALPFEPPSLQRFTDMQDILLVDPIHEVDESGWPQRT
ncbi:MAG: PqqD family protein, partial [Chloroflexi bacterium]|nr:PqqD family protein [Chloroflexota bacterium]